MSKRLLAAALLLTLAACSGGGHSAPASAPASGQAASAMRSGTLTLTIPAAGATTSAARTPKSISSATQSVSISINGATPVMFNVTPTSNGCSVVAGATKCTLTLGAPVGNDAFAISTYSGLNGTGAVLDTATMTFAIAANVAFAITVNLGPVVSTTADSGAGSLRAAIAQANPGDTITFLPGVTGTIALTSGAITLAQNVTLGGPGAANLTISGTNSSQIFVVSAGVTAAISGLTLANGKIAATANCACGGAIDNEGILTVGNIVFTNNSAPGGEGGGIYTDTGTTLTVSNSTFAANAAQYGGAIGSESPNTTVSGATFTNNTAIGPSSSDVPEGGAIYSDDDIMISGSTFTSNVSGGNGASENFGGAIVEDNFTTTGLTVSNTTFASNQAGVPANGDASGDGGAIFDDTNDVMMLSGNTFGGGNGLGNKANGTSDSYGGAIESSAASISLGAGNTFSYNAVTSQSTSAESVGGAIALLGPTGDLTINGANTFADNSVSAGPGASGGFAEGGAIADFTAGAFDLHTAAGTSFTNNSATATDSLGNATGGAIQYNGNAVCPCDEAHNRRAGPSVSSFRSRHGSASAMAKHAARTAQSASGARRAVLTASSYTISGVTFTANRATGGYGVTGGAISFEANQNPITVSNSTFSSNSASAGQTGYAGAISVAVGTLTLASDQITGNTATQAGGGISVNTYGTMTVTNCTITGNSVSSAVGGAGGGGINSGLAATLSVTGSTIANNMVSGSVAGSGGGGVQTWSSTAATATIVNSTITGNTSSVDGGGIENLASYTLNLINVTDYANSASSGDGGNLNTQAIATTQNTIFAGGTATGGGGADINVNGAGSLTSSGNNWIQTAVVGPFGPLGSDHVSAGSPQLAAGLANNGGPTQTIADMMTSPVRHAITFAGGVCGTSGPATDQRGNARGAGGFCDIGAYEFP
ncbi:MAG TPA: choice-of-anchor Q domain-containing protein [Candidatus Lustribacter sp.]|nr:choice-of-anchor Q domain-containing protein [Candidatus Lustribacter sp.]